MADDRTELIGNWKVKFRSWTWEYAFSADGTVVWRDPLNNLKGAGRWAKSGNLVNFSWAGSSTKESWHCPVRPIDQTGWVSASYGSGALKAQKIVAASQSGPNDVAPAIAGVPWERYVDQFTECKYDVNYKIPADQSFAFSSILRLKYGDGAAIELDIGKDFSSQAQTSEAARDAMARGSIGQGGRIFPTVLTERTTPRLWVSRADALRAQDQAVEDFSSLAMGAIAFILSVPAMPAGVLGSAASTSARVTRRTVPATRVPPAPISNNAVKLGAPGEPGNLFSRIQSSDKGIVYLVDMIVLEGKGSQVAVARSTHREMIKQAARTAQSNGQQQFKMIGKQANSNFAKHADRVAQEIGVPGSGRRINTGGPGHSDYEVILDVAKALGLP